MARRAGYERPSLAGGLDGKIGRQRDQRERWIGRKRERWIGAEREQA
jgi:hypothetical protein